MKACLLLALAGLCLAGCGAPDSAKALSEAGRPISVRTTVAIDAQEPVTVPVLGAITSQSRSNIGAEADGRVVALLVREGQHVKAGQALIQLAADDAQTRFSAAEGGLKQALLSGQADEQITAAKLAQAKLDFTRRQDQLSSEVKLAEARFAEVQAHFDQLKRGPRPQEIEAANSDVVAAQSVVESGQATADYAKLILKRKSSLLSQGGISQNEVDAAQLDFDHAVQSVHFAEQQLRAKQLFLNLLKEGTPKEEMAQGAAQLSAAKESYRAAKANLASLEDARQLVTMAQADHDRAFARLQQLRSGSVSDEGAKVLLAQQDVERTQIRTPIDGVVSSIKVVKGQVAKAGQMVAEVIGQGGVQMEATAMDDDVAKIQPGQRVNVTLRDSSRKVYGIVREVLPPGSEGRSSRIVISLGDSARLVAGHVANGEVQTSVQRNLVKISEDALFSELDGQADVYVVVRNLVRERPIQIGSRHDGLVSVLGGLSAGEQVVMHPSKNLHDGARILVSTGPGEHK